nr:ohanin-like [Pelodiscus sinensis]XP_025038066.1 ohanin-like [Pelodiscus sinensis]|eukprot:XP_014426645.1 ohanin-like [Pelodiscus sinensis]
MAAPAPESTSWESPNKHALHTFEENVTLDPKTAHPNLVLCKKRKYVTSVHPPQDLPDNPKRFDTVPCVLGSEGFTSRKHYWEVVVGNQREWAVGVARDSVRRKGSVQLTPEERIWALGRWWVGYGSVLDPRVGSGSSASEHREDEAHETEHRGEHTEAAHLLSGYEGAETIGVLLEYGKGKVTFYEQDKVTIMRVDFGGEEVFPFFYVGPGVHLKVIP